MRLTLNFGLQIEVNDKNECNFEKRGVLLRLKLIFSGLTQSKYNHFIICFNENIHKGLISEVNKAICVACMISYTMICVSCCHLSGLYKQKNELTKNVLV